MATVGEILVSIGLDTDNLTKGLNKAEKGLDKFGKKASAIGKNLTLSITAPLTAAAAGVIKLASDLEETNAKFETTFKGVQKEASETAKLLQRDYGLSIRASKSLLASTGDLLNGFGFTKDEALNLSAEIQKLAVDLASFNNFSGGAAGASEILTKALLGERDALLSLNTKISEADVQNKLLEKGQKDLTGAALLQAKALATLELVQQQNINAQGDFNRTSGSLANQLRILKAQTEDLGAEIGFGLLPLATKLVTWAKDAVNSFRSLTTEQKKWGLELTAGLALLGPFTFLVGKVSELSASFVLAVQNMTKAIKGFNMAMLKTVGRVSAVVVGIAGFLLLAKSIYDTFEPLQTFFKNLWDKIVSLFTKALEVISSALEPVLKWLGVSFDDAIEGLGEIWDSFIETFEEGAEALKIPDIWENMKKNLEKVSEVLGEGAKALLKPIFDMIGEIDKGFEGMAQKMGAGGKGEDSKSEGLLPAFLPDLGLSTDTGIDSEKLDKIEDKSEKIAAVWEDIGTNIAAFIDRVGDALISTLADAIVEGKNLADTFEDFGKELAKAAAKMAIITGIKAFLGVTSGGALGGPTMFAKGGIVSGPTLGMMGEYPGAKTNPEVIAPLSDLKQMIAPMAQPAQAQNIDVSGQFEIRGEDLTYIIRRTLRNELQTLGQNNLQGGNVQL